MSNDNSEDYYVLNLRDLFSILWTKKLIIIIVTLVFAIFSIFYALSLPNIYTSSAILAPTHKEDSLNSRMAALSSVASLAGVPVQADSSSKTQEAIERIKSLDFFTNYFLPNIKSQDLLAAETWSIINNKISYDDELYDISAKKWIRDVKFPKTPKPSSQEFYDEYRKILSISEDKKTYFVNISIQHISPHIAKAWLDIIIDNINLSMQEEEKLSATNSIQFLNNASQETSKNELKEAIAALLETQLQKLMLASAEKSYVFKKINSPFVPEIKTSPNRKIICIVITFFGGLLGVIIGLIDYQYRDKPRYKAN